MLRLLVLSAPIEIGGNTPVEFLLENSNINMINYYIDLECNNMADFPDFDQIFVAAPGDDSVNNPYIQHISQIITENGLQVINSPDQIMKLDRDMLPEAAFLTYRKQLSRPINENFEILSPGRILKLQRSVSI